MYKTDKVIQTHLYLMEIYVCTRVKDIFFTKHIVCKGKTSSIKLCVDM